MVTIDAVAGFHHPPKAVFIHPRLLFTPFAADPLYAKGRLHFFLHDLVWRRLHLFLIPGNLRVNVIIQLAVFILPIFIRIQVALCLIFLKVGDILLVILLGPLRIGIHMIHLIPLEKCLCEMIYQLLVHFLGRNGIRIHGTDFRQDYLRICLDYQPAVLVAFLVLIMLRRPQRLPQGLRRRAACIPCVPSVSCVLRFLALIVLDAVCTLFPDNGLLGRFLTARQGAYAKADCRG